MIEVNYRLYYYYYNQINNDYNNHNIINLTTTTTCYDTFFLFVVADFNAILGSHFGRPDDAVHMSNVGCFGDELKLSACSFASIDIGDAQVYQTVAGVTCRAKSFNTTSSTPTSTSTATPTATTDQASSSDPKTAVTNVVIILGVVVFIAIVAAVV